jgi:hypothetical protein
MISAMSSFVANGVGSGAVHAGLILKKKSPGENRGSGEADYKLIAGLPILAAWQPLSQSPR